MEAGARVAGSRFAYLKGPLVRLELALVQWSLTLLEEKGFTPVIPPVLVREEALYGTGQLPDTEQQIYRVPEDDLYLAGTSEVPLASLHAGQILAAGDLPLRYAGFSPASGARRARRARTPRASSGCTSSTRWRCSRSWTRPSHRPSTSGCWPSRRRSSTRSELPYRVVNIAVDDLGASAAKKYDLEAWLPGQGRYRELTSTSNTTDFQARRLDMRYRERARAAAPARAHAERHGRGRGPHHHRPGGERPARGRQHRHPRGPAPVRRTGGDRRGRRG